MWCIQCVRDGRQLPTFYLDMQVQGITHWQHAERIAKEIVGEGVNVHVEFVAKHPL